MCLARPVLGGRERQIYQEVLPSVIMNSENVPNVANCASISGYKAADGNTSAGSKKLSNIATRFLGSHQVVFQSDLDGRNIARLHRANIFPAFYTSAYNVEEQESMRPFFFLKEYPYDLSGEPPEENLETWQPYWRGSSFI